ncbi:MAG: hypothetical protein IKT20_06275 [Clostridiales bacterium]|nr:hypothetical protein [Clostridiales bacterium]MBR6488498.1 hypothetical protein [Clostridiales bacterium]
MKIRKTISKAAVLALAATFVFALASCGGTGSAGVAPKSQDEIAGTWEKVLPDGVETIIIYNDGRYVSEIKLNGGTTTTNTRTYVLKDGKLTVDYPELQTKSSYKVILKDGKLTMDNGDTTSVYTKK